MNWSLLIQLLVILSIKLIGTTLFLRYPPQIFYTSFQDVPDSNRFQPSPIPSKEGAKDCPTSWKLFEGKCYFFSAQEKTWNNSKKDCEQSDAHLAIVNSNAELMFLKNRTETMNYFVGLSRRDTGGRWKWTDNTDLDQTIFNIPHKDHDCAVVGFLMTGTGSCSVPARWICEMNT